MKAKRNRNGGSWASHLPSCLKLLFHPLHDDQSKRPFRMTHVTDRPARSPVSQATPMDEECLQYLLAVQQQKINSPGRPCSSVYGCQEGKVSPFLHGVGASGREFARRTGRHVTRSPGVNAERILVWDAVVTRFMSPPFTPDSSDLNDTWGPGLYRHHVSQTTIQSSDSVPLQGQHIGQHNHAKHALTRGTWPAQDPLYTHDIARSKGAQAPGHPSSPRSLAPGAQDDSDSDYDVYEGWAEYYFDETNFRDRDGQGRYTGEITGYVRLPTIGEYF